MIPAPEILIVDDDDAIRAVFGHVLRIAGFAVTECPDGVAAVERWKEFPPALILLDVEMPRMNGWKTLAELRRIGCTQPILMVTSMNHVDARVQGLETGADDYLGKPCNAYELVARVRALLRRASRPPVEIGVVLHFGELKVDLTKKKAQRGSTAVPLTATDYKLLSLLREHLGEPVSRELIVERVWSSRANATHALETHLWRLRKKLGEAGGETNWIRNLPGVGYVLDAAAAGPAG